MTDSTITTETPTGDVAQEVSVKKPLWKVFKDAENAKPTKETLKMWLNSCMNEIRTNEKLRDKVYQKVVDEIKEKGPDKRSRAVSISHFQGKTNFITIFKTELPYRFVEMLEVIQMYGTVWSDPVNDPSDELYEKCSLYLISTSQYGCSGAFDIYIHLGNPEYEYTPPQIGWWEKCVNFFNGL